MAGAFLLYLTMKRIQKDYDQWASKYDSQQNKTRDLEKEALRKTIGGIKFSSCLEIGCGTGKNTGYLSKKSGAVLAIDISRRMLALAMKKKYSGRVDFIQADISKAWPAGKKKFELVVFSLVLEHFKNISRIIGQAAVHLKKGGYVYIGELHPYKQYKDSKARFETGNGLKVLDCYTHHISDFTNAANENGLRVVTLNEFFDRNDKEGAPRILSLLLKKEEDV
jgi:ubiquinone/menaquinone biosynthesis C-methylase UbiE